MRLSLFHSLRAHFLPGRSSSTTAERDAIHPPMNEGPRVTSPLRRRSDRHICVIGAGFAGLACAYELTLQGYRVTVIEPRDHVGGRVRTLTDFVPGKRIEAGAELIGSNHTTWLRLAGEFGLHLVPLPPETGVSPLYLHGKLLSARRSRQINQQADDLLLRLNPLAQHVNADRPWLSAGADALDRMSLADWIALQSDIDPLARHLAQSKWEGKNAVPADRQSLLAFLAMIRGGGLDKFWADSENLRCVDGNQSLAIKLANVVGADHIWLNEAVASVEHDDHGATVATRSGRSLHADEVVLTAPPSVWPKIKFTPALPAELVPQMGMAVKYIAHVGSPFWKSGGLSPESTTDDLLTHTWDGTPGQAGKGDVLQGFVGGQMALRVHEMPATERHAAYTRLLETLYPVYAEQRRKAKFIDWIADPHSRGGYSFPAPGEVTRIGPILDRGIRHLHFAGEYASYAFIGYMEGALRTGMTIARRMAVRDGITQEPLAAA